MPNIVALPCKCGREVRATDPMPGAILRCIYCGAEQVYAPEGKGAPRDAGTGIQSEFPGFDPGPLICESCGGELKVRYSGPRKTDRIAVCLYCKTKVDLPEKRGMTSEEVIRRPGEHIVKKVTRWEEVSGSTVELDPLEMDFEGEFLDDAESGSYKVSTASDEVEFDNIDDFREYIEKKVPPGQAKKILAMIPTEKAGVTVESTTTVKKSGSATIRSMEDDDGLFSRLKGLFKRKK